MTPFDEMQEEMRLHLEERAADLERRGLSAEEARRQARLEFGSVGRYLEEGREERGGAFWERWRLDFEMAGRSLRRQPALLAALVLQLALTVAVAAVAYPLLRDALARPIPVTDAERVFLVRTRVPQLEGLYPDWPVSVSHFRLWQRGCKGCEASGLVNSAELHWMDGKAGRRLEGLQVSAGFFDVLGLRMQLGRGIGEGEEASVVISDALWRTRFGGDESVLGEKLQVNGQTLRVVGVLPAGAFLPICQSMGRMLALPESVDALVAIPADAGKGQGMMGYFDWGLLVKTRAAASEVEKEFEGALVQAGLTEGDVRVSLRNWDEELTSAARGKLEVFGWAVGAWLALSLFCWRGLARARRWACGKEEEVQMQMGAGPGDQWRRRAAEALWLLGPAAVLGLAMGALALRYVPKLYVKWHSLGVGWEAAIVVLATAGIGYGFARRGSDPKWECAAQAGIATVLAALSLSMGWSYWRVLQQEQGFAGKGAIAFDVSGPRVESDTAEWWKLEKAVLRELRKEPSVLAAATTSRLPLEGEAALFTLRAEGVTAGPQNFRVASEGYFEAMGIAVLRGRSFVAGDEGKRVVVLSASAAREAFGSVEALGRRIHYTWDGARVLMEVVGVVEDVRAERVDGALTPMAYVMPRPEMEVAKVFVVRARDEASDLVQVARAAVRQVNDGARVQNVRGLEDLVGRNTVEIRWQSYGVALLGVTGLVVASFGMAALVYFDTRARRAELGLRRALGATKRELAWGVSWQAIVPVVWGVGLGAAVAVAWAEWLVVPVVVLAILGASWAASYWPARSGVEVELREAIRRE